MRNLLYWLKRKPYIASASLNHFDEHGLRAQVTVGLTPAFGEKFENGAKNTFRPDDGRLDEQRRRLSEDLLCAELSDGPELVDVDLEVGDYVREVAEDFEEPDGYFRSPARVLIDFDLGPISNSCTNQYPRGGVMVEKVVEKREELWTVDDVCRYLKASKSWIYKAAERGDLPTVRVGALLRFIPEEIRRYVAGSSQGGRP